MLTSIKDKKFLFPLAALIIIIFIEIIFILILNSGLFVYTTDDAYIHLSLSENIVNGHYGINPGENSSPSSSIIWAFILTPFNLINFIEIAPLLINILASAGSVYIFFLFLIKIFNKELDESKYEKIIILFNILLIISANLVGFIFNGMEHSLQLLLTFLIIYGLILNITENKLPAWVLPVIVIAPLIRYENLALSFVSLIFLYLQGKKREALISFLIIIILAGSFSLFLLNIGLHPLPLSVMKKSSFTSPTGIEGIVNNLIENLFNPRALLLFIISLLLLYSSQKEILKEKKLFVVLFIAAVWIHLIFGGNRRYVVYIWSASLLVLLFVYRDRLIRIINRYSFKRILIIFLFPLAVISFFYLMNIFTIPIASNNIYEQHYQMHRFAADYYKKPVAVNDIGYVSFKNDNYVLDLVGLASSEALKYSISRNSTEWINVLSKKHNIELAMIYDEWFEDIPKSWYKAGKLYLGKIKITPSRKAVSFYLLNEGRKEETLSLLKKFSETLPEGVKFIFNE